jgi:hypothetical protein
MRSDYWRFAHNWAAPPWLNRQRARLLLIAVVALIGIGFGVAGTPPSSAAESASSGVTDLELFQRIAVRVGSGESYYHAAIAEQLQNGYPTTPAMAVRLPTLTYLEVALGHVGMTVMLAVLVVALLTAMLLRVAHAGSGSGAVEQIAVVGVLAASVALYPLGSVTWFHDAWAGVLIALAVALHRDQRWWPSLIVGLAAVSIRELAWPFLVVMAVLAWPRRRRESIAWIAGAMGFLAVYMLHVGAVQAVQPGVSAPSQGWLGCGGWGFILNAVRSGSVLFAAPMAIVVIVVPLALFGWLFSGDLARPVLGTCLAFIGIFLVIGRADNSYWGLLFAALLLAGIAFAPRGLVVTARTAIGADARRPDAGMRR